MEILKYCFHHCSRLSNSNYETDKQLSTTHINEDDILPILKISNIAKAYGLL